ncbi:MAG: hypothetical protein KAJ75_06930 [Alphaproteobacteria bacterium]|nr:hypothetical protein [Alphaproteobacteria bacterium]
MPKITPKEEKRSKMLHTYVNQKEHEDIKEIASELNMTVSDYLRSLALNQPLPNVDASLNNGL